MQKKSSSCTWTLVKAALAVCLGGAAISLASPVQALPFQLDLDHYVGKCPFQTDILELPRIERRLHAVMGRDYWKLGVGLGAQSPMAAESTENGRFLVLEGNKEHDAAALRIIVVIDLAGGRVDVATREDGCKVRQYLDRRAESSDVSFDNFGYPVTTDVARWVGFVNEADSCI